MVPMRMMRPMLIRVDTYVRNSTAFSAAARRFEDVGDRLAVRKR
jgi:hypothetical protein